MTVTHRTHDTTEPDPREGLLRIGALAERLGVSTRTLRFWEAQGLLPAPRRTEGGFRLYDDRHVRVARGIQRLKDVGFALAEILAMRTGFHGQRTAHAGMTLLEQRLATRERELRELIRRQQRLVREVEALRACLAHCDGCGGKRFDTECVTCLSRWTGSELPDSLDTLFSTTESPTR